MVAALVGIAMVSVWYDLYPLLREEFSRWEWELL